MKKTTRKSLTIQTVAPTPDVVLVLRDQLEQAVRSLDDCNPEKGQPFEGFIVLEGRGGTLRVRNVDGDANAILEIAIPDATPHGKVPAFKPIGVSRGDLLNRCKESKETSIKLTVLFDADRPEGHRWSITADGHPIADKASPGPVFSVSGKPLAEVKAPLDVVFNALNHASWSASDVDRAVLANIGLDNGRVIGSDGHRMHLAMFPLKVERKVSFHARGWDAMANALDRLGYENGASLTVRLFDEYLTIDTEAFNDSAQRVTLTARLDDDEYVEWQRVTPAEGPRGTVNAATFAELVSRAQEQAKAWKAEHNSPHTQIGLAFDVPAKRLGVYAPSDAGRVLVGEVAAELTPDVHGHIVTLQADFVTDLLTLWSWAPGVTVQIPDSYGPVCLSPTGVGGVLTVAMCIKSGDEMRAPKAPAKDKALAEALKASLSKVKGGKVPQKAPAKAPSKPQGKPEAPKATPEAPQGPQGPAKAPKTPKAPKASAKAPEAPAKAA